MRRLIAIGIVLAVAAFAAARVHAASAEDTYFAARDAAIARIKAVDKSVDPVDPVPPTVIDLDNLGALPRSEQQMRAIVGPVTIKGMTGAPKINLDTLYEGDEGFGILDGMVYGGLDAKTRVIVTTDSVFRHWLREHKQWLGKYIRRNAAGA